MPQLIVADFAPQIVWLVITFVALYLVMAKVALPKIEVVLEERQDRLADDIEQAETYRNSAETALKAYEQELAEAHANALQIGQTIREEISADASRRKIEIELELEERLKLAEGEIQKMREEVLSNVQMVATEAATSVVGRLIGVDLDRAEIVAAVKKETGDG